MRAREEVLSEQPLCVLCRAEGRTVEAVEVDHIIPIKHGGTDDRQNLRGLCRPCHDAVTAALYPPKGSTLDGIPRARLREARP